MSFSWPQLLILLLVIIAVFGTKKFRNLGSDLGTAVKGFKKAMQDDSADSAEQKSLNTADADKKDKEQG